MKKLIKRAPSRSDPPPEYDPLDAVIYTCHRIPTTTHAKSRQGHQLLEKIPVKEPITISTI